jgi:hypothetical protein
MSTTSPQQQAAEAPRRGSGSGSLASSYAGRAHLEMEAAADAAAAGQPAPARSYPVVLATHAGVAHSTLNLTDGLVVDPAKKKMDKFENEKYLRAHPELNGLIQDFVVHVLETRPASVEDAAIEFFMREGEARSNAAAAAPQAKP